MNAKTVTLDVREDIRSGHEPFGKIMNAVAALQSGERLRLIAPFEPVPLFHVLKQQGFVHEGQAMVSGDWEVLFTRVSEPQLKSGTTPEIAVDSRQGDTSVPTEILSVDARGLEPPQPLVKILETLTALPLGAELRAHTDRRPIHLYAQLDDRGFTATSEEQTDGSFVTQIRHR